MAIRSGEIRILFLAGQHGPIKSGLRGRRREVVRQVLFVESFNLEIASFEPTHVRLKLTETEHSLTNAEHNLTDTELNHANGERRLTNGERRHANLERHHARVSTSIDDDSPIGNRPDDWVRSSR